MTQSIPNASLTNLVAQQQDTAPAPAPVPPSVPATPAPVNGLASFETPPPSAPAVSAPAAPAPSPRAQPVSPSPFQQPAAPTVPQPAAASSFGDILRDQEGFTSLPEGMSNEELAKVIGHQIDDSNRMEKEIEQYRQQSSAPKEAPQAAPQMTPAVPAAATSASIPTQLSPDAEAVAQSGLVFKDESGAWAAKNPAFQQFADEHNRFDAYRQQVAHQIVSKPEEFFRQQAENLGVAKAEDVKILMSQVQTLREQLASQRQTEAESEMQGFLDKNRPHLFVDGDVNKPTEYTKKYNAFARQIHDMAKGFGQELDSTQVHSRTLQMLESAGVQLQPTQPHVSQPASQQTLSVEPPSFMQQAATSAPSAPVNRLPMTEYPSQNPGEYQVPIGSGGKPNLTGIIEHQRTNGIAY